MNSNQSKENNNQPKENDIQSKEKHLVEMARCTLQQYLDRHINKETKQQ